MSSENSSECNKLEKEFETIEKNRSWTYIYLQIKGESMKNEFTVDEAKRSYNKNLNRYRDVNPYDHSRVILSREEYEYINASYITVKEARRKYILTQGPLLNTIVHFWLMVWEQNSKAIIMLNKIFEKNQPKCSQYWPISTSDNDSRIMELPEVDLRVELLTEKDYSHYIVRNIRLTNLQTDNSREILHFHYTTWPDFGVPQSPLAFLKFLRNVRQSEAFDSEYGPPIVHCSAGIGRSGTFCLVDTCLILMEEKGVDNVDITSVLLEMRNCRMGLIQMPDQLRFSYIAIIHGLKMDWKAQGDDGIPDELLSQSNNGDSKLSDSEDEAPPLPPPRNPNHDLTKKPLPEPPCEPSTDSSITESDEESDVSETESTIILPKGFIDDSFSSETNNASTGTNEPRKRKHSETESKSQRISKKVQEMKNKQNDCEKYKKKRSIFINITLGVSVVAISGVIIAYFWYGKNS